MSSNGHPVVVTLFPMAPGARFDRHTHPDHQLAWASSGVLTVTTDIATWVLPPTRALWIPALVGHTVTATNRATMIAAYLRPGSCAISWTEPTPVRAGALLRDLIGYLSADSLDGPLDPGRRHRAEAVLVDVLEPVAVTGIELRMPTDRRALDVADALLADPLDLRSLGQWGRAVGASGRTLARVFLAETGVPFGRWRTMARLQAALPRIARGEPVGNVARGVGYRTPSAFVAAFHREIGVTPGAYFHPGP